MPASTPRRGGPSPDLHSGADNVSRTHERPDLSKPGRGVSAVRQPTVHASTSSATVRLMSEPEAPAATTPAPNPKAARVYLGILAVIGLLAIAGIPYLIWVNSDSHQAKKACEAYVKTQLKTPSTAKFSGEEYFSTDHSVHGNVDAQNEFGASIRSLFSCSVSHVGGTWTVTDGYVI